LTVSVFNLLTFAIVWVLKSEDAGNITCIRFLITNAEAGSVIGKGGATISDLQSQSAFRV